MSKQRQDPRGERDRKGYEEDSRDVWETVFEDGIKKRVGEPDWEATALGTLGGAALGAALGARGQRGLARKLKVGATAAIPTGALAGAYTNQATLKPIRKKDRK